MIEIKNLNFSYTQGHVSFSALKNVNLNIEAGDIFTIEGPSGSGKSTLLNILGFIEMPEMGQVFFENKDISLLTENEKNHIRRFDIGFIFQHFYLFPILTVYENIEYFLIKQKVSKTEREKLIMDALEMFNIKDLSKKFPTDLSGGQRQRVAIARAFAKRPRIIIADEPTASLDHENAKVVIDALKLINKKLGATVVIASHDVLVLNEFEKRIKILDGELKGSL